VDWTNGAGALGIATHHRSRLPMFSLYFSQIKYIYIYIHPTHPATAAFVLEKSYYRYEK